MESMTGYGRHQAEADGLRLLVEIRGVNNKGLDVHLSLPAALLCHEMAVRQRIRSAVARGRVEGRISLEFLGEQAVEVHYSHGVAQALGHLASRLEGEGVLARGMTLGDFLALPDAVSVRLRPDAEARAGDLLLACVEKALECFLQTRREEGRRLEEQFRQASGHMKAHLDALGPMQALQVETVRERLNQKLQQVAISVDATRVEQEVVLAAEKADVEEEVVRLKAHHRAMEELLEKNPADLGRRLDHLFQEMYREISTLLAKATFFDLTQVALRMRLLVEQLREQAQNVA